MRELLHYTSLTSHLPPTYNPPANKHKPPLPTPQTHESTRELDSLGPREPQAIPDSLRLFPTEPQKKKLHSSDHHRATPVIYYRTYTFPHYTSFSHATHAARRHTDKQRDHHYIANPTIPFVTLCGNDTAGSCRISQPLTRPSTATLPPPTPLTSPPSPPRPSTTPQAPLQKAFRQ